jgi:hypothetical protein
MLQELAHLRGALTPLLEEDEEAGGGPEHDEIFVSQGKAILLLSLISRSHGGIERPELRRVTQAHPLSLQDIGAPRRWPAPWADECDAGSKAEALTRLKAEAAEPLSQITPALIEEKDPLGGGDIRE